MGTGGRARLRLDALEAPLPPPPADTHIGAVQHDHRHEWTASGPTSPAGGSFTPPLGGRPSRATQDPYAANAHILRAVATAHVPRDAAATAVESLLLLANIQKNDCTMRGPHLGVSFTVHFEGTDAESAAMATQALAAMRRDDRSYRSGSIADPRATRSPSLCIRTAAWRTELGAPWREAPAKCSNKLAWSSSGSDHKTDWCPWAGSP